MSNKYIEQLVKMAEEKPAPTVLGHIAVPTLGGAALGGALGSGMAKVIGVNNAVDIALELELAKKPHIKEYWERDADLTRVVSRNRVPRWAKRGAALGALTLGGAGTAGYLLKKNDKI